MNQIETIKTWFGDDDGLVKEAAAVNFVPPATASPGVDLVKRGLKAWKQRAARQMKPMTLEKRADSLVHYGIGTGIGALGGAAIGAAANKKDRVQGALAGGIAGAGAGGFAVAAARLIGHAQALAKSRARTQALTDEIRQHAKESDDFLAKVREWKKEGKDQRTIVEEMKRFDSAREKKSAEIENNLRLSLVEALSTPFL